MVHKPYTPKLLFAVVLVLAFALGHDAAHAQGRGSGGGGGRGPFGSPGGGGRPQPGDHAGGNNPGRDTAAGSHAQTGPTGRWWDDTAYAHAVGLSGTQQKRMDQVFEQNRDGLFKLLGTLKHEEAQLTKVSKNAGASEAEVDAQIDRVAQARTELQKANTHLQLELRRQLTADQVSRIDQATP